LLNIENEVYRWGIEFSKFSPRIPGTINIDNARDFIVNKLKSFGLKTWLEPINFRGVFYHDWELLIKSPEIRKIKSTPQNNVGLGSVDAEIIDIGKGEIKDYKDKDVKNKIVLINWGKLTDHEGPCGLKKRYPLLASYDHAWEHEAAAMIGYFTDTPGNSLKILEPGINPTGGSNITGPALPNLATPDSRAHRLTRLHTMDSGAKRGAGELCVRLTKVRPACQTK